MLWSITYPYRLWTVALIQSIKLGLQLSPRCHVALCEVQAYITISAYIHSSVGLSPCWSLQRVPPQHAPMQRTSGFIVGTHLHLHTCTKLFWSNDVGRCQRYQCIHLRILLINFPTVPTTYLPRAESFDHVCILQTQPNWNSIKIVGFPTSKRFSFQYIGIGSVDSRTKRNEKYKFGWGEKREWWEKKEYNERKERLLVFGQCKVP